MPVGNLMINKKSFENELITDNPQFSYFSSTIANTSDFSMEDTTQYFLNGFGFGKKSCCYLHNNSDLINNVYLVVNLPSLPTLERYENIGFAWRWVENVGHAVVKNIDVEIGNKVVQSFNGTYLDVFHKLRKTRSKSIDHMIGNVDSLRMYTSRKEAYKLYVPIPFWFTREYGNSFPIGKTGVKKVKINVDFSNLGDVLSYGPTHYIDIDESEVLFDKYETIYQKGTGAMGEFFFFDSSLKRMYYNPLSSVSFSENNSSFIDNIFTKKERSLFITNGDDTLMYSPVSIPVETNLDIQGNYNIVSSYLLVSYIYLSSEEQEFMSKQEKLKYIIQQTNIVEYKDVESRKQDFSINSKNPCYEMIWVCVSSENVGLKKYFEYSSSPVSTSVFFNSYDIVSKRRSDYLTSVSRFENYSCMENENINVHSFSLSPLEYQPSGSINLDKIEKISVKMEFDSRVNPSNKLNVYFFVNTYNVLSISTDKNAETLF